MDDYKPVEPSGPPRFRYIRPYHLAILVVFMAGRIFQLQPKLVFGLVFIALVIGWIWQYRNIRS